MVLHFKHAFVIFLVAFACMAITIRAERQRDPDKRSSLDVTCANDSDCGDSLGQLCALSEARQSAELVCCSSIVRVCRFPSWSLKMECFDVCAGRGAGAACEKENDVCASGVCGMDGLCQGEKIADESPCLDDAQCGSGVCGKSEAIMDVGLVCCTNGTYEFDVTHGRVCAGRISGAACDGNHDVCASRVCGLDNLCKDEIPGACVGIPSGCGEAYEPLFGLIFNGTCGSGAMDRSTMHCESRSGCRCDDEDGKDGKFCIGTPIACENHLDASSCHTQGQGGCSWESYYPGICVDAKCGPLHKPSKCSNYYTSTFNQHDSCETNVDKCKPSCTGEREGCVCSTYDYDCALKFKNGLTQTVCEGTTVCDHVEGRCSSAQSRADCLALGEDGAGCKWMVLFRDWEENFIEGEDLDEKKNFTLISSTIPDSEGEEDNSSIVGSPGSATASDTNPSSSTRENLSVVVVLVAFLIGL